MSKTLAFTELDFRLIKPYAKHMLFYLALGIAMGIGLKSGSILASFFMVALMLTMSYPFTISEKNGLDILYGTLSLGKNTVVTGRYVFVLVLAVVFFVLAFAGSMALNSFLGIELIIGETLGILCVLSGVFLIIAAYQYPVYFKYGYTKARLLAIAPLFIVYLAVIQLPTLAKQFGWSYSWESILAGITNNPFYLYVTPIIIGLVTLLLSCVLSCRIYAKRDI